MSAFFFDFDGTLFDTNEDIRLAWKETLRVLSRACPQFDARYVVGPSLEEMVLILFPEVQGEERAQLIADVRANFGRIYDASGFPTTRPYPQALEWVKDLAAAGTRLFVATNKRRIPTETLLRREGIADLFEGVYTSDLYLHAEKAPAGVPTDRTLKKPEYLKLALAERGVDPTEATMVGDTTIDIAAGKANGLRTIGVTWGYGSRESLVAAGADEVRDAK